MSDPFFLPTTYRTNAVPMTNDYPVYDPVDMQHRGLIFQYHVYEMAAELIKTQGLRSVADVGCSAAVKLDKLIRPTGATITGYDSADQIDVCRRHYDFGSWREIDLDIMDRPGDPADEQYDLIIAADVIEHLNHPGHLLDFVKAHLQANGYVIFSTPTRDKLYPPRLQSGPPNTEHHVREWAFDEFAKYLNSNGLNVERHTLVRERLAPAFPSREWLGYFFGKRLILSLPLIRRTMYFTLKQQVAVCRVSSPT